MAGRFYCLQIEEGDKKGQWTWEFEAGDGGLPHVSGALFETCEDCKKNIEWARKEVAGAVVDCSCPE